MRETKIYPPRWYDPILAVFFRLAASGYVPASWFRAPIPEPQSRSTVDGIPTLEVVSHCWQYSNMLAYQLSSFVNYPPTRLKLIVTVFYCAEDEGTSALLNFIEKHDVENVTWNWQALPKEQLFRRGIGRNRAAKSTQADWVWFTDCDIIFHQNCMDSLADELQGRRDVLLFPREERTTPMLARDDVMLKAGSKPQLVDIEAANFTRFSRDRAKGAFQIVHGDVARAIGYCGGISIYQTPAEHWCKCYEDRAFRWLVGTQGTPINVDGVYQVRHIHKGRYKQNSIWSRIRSKIRRLKEQG
ncbi:glycosyltransferase family A protein [Vreelandella utahensis]|uniref:glycosyltransferase family A protein n=1 Tax=Vreelandella halophila TaxID=86177 RepID=UPI000986AD6E|nr:glycosyltransferase family A protein [Halomonas utahensis]